MSSTHQLMTAALAADPRVVEVLDGLCGDTGRSPLIRLTCKGSDRRTQRHDTGATVRFKRAQDGWTLVAGRGSAAMPGAGTDGSVTVSVLCTRCNVQRLRGTDALRPMLTELTAWVKRRDELAVPCVSG